MYHASADFPELHSISFFFVFSGRAQWVKIFSGITLEWSKLQMQCNVTTLCLDLYLLVLETLKCIKCDFKTNLRHTGSLKRRRQRILNLGFSFAFYFQAEKSNGTGNISCISVPAVAGGHQITTWK